MKELKLSNTDRVALVDDEDYERLLVYTWSQTKSNINKGIVRRSYKFNDRAVNVSLSHEVMRTVWIQYDHKDRNPLNNQKSNLRPATNRQNACNKAKRSGAYSSKYKGVSFCKKTEKWKAYGALKGCAVWLGYHETAEKAAIKYNEFAEKTYKEFAVLNVL
jgi:hypothetical protein